MNASPLSIAFSSLEAAAAAVQAEHPEVGRLDLLRACRALAATLDLQQEEDEIATLRLLLGEGPASLSGDLRDSDDTGGFSPSG